MRRDTLFYILLLYFISMPFMMFAQEQNNTLESNPVYHNLKAERDSLNQIQTSLKAEIEKYKELSETDEAKKEDHVAMVLQLEGRLFDLRNKIGIVVSKCNAIEQEYIIKNLNKKPASQETESGSKLNTNTNILQNKFLIDNLSAEEMRMMRSGDTIDSVAYLLCDSVNREYEIIRELDRLLRQTQEVSTADSLFAIAETAYDKVTGYEKELKKAWGDMFDTKVYVYTRLLDKLNVSVDILSGLNEKYKEVRNRSEMADSSKFSSVFYTYPFKRELILNYEKILSEKLVYMSAIDSLDRKIETVRTFHCDFPNVELPDWNYIHFVAAKVGGAGVHSLTHPVHDIKIPTLGTVYTIRIATLTNKLAQTTALRRINPVTVFHNELGKYEYHAGFYKTKEEAEADVPKMKAAGFNSVVVAWRDGGKVLDNETIIPLNVADSYYCVEFDSVTPEITAKLKELAPNKELSRIDDRYSVGFFKNYLDAVKIKRAIGVECRIVPIEIN